MKLAIVGARESKWTPEKKVKVKEIIRGILTDDGVELLISGGCPKGGVDIWAEEIANELGITTAIFNPTENQWEYYKLRNMLIAHSCDELVCIEPKGIKGGGSWTLNYAESIGKKIKLIEV